MLVIASCQPSAPVADEDPVQKSSKQEYHLTGDLNSQNVPVFWYEADSTWIKLETAASQVIFYSAPDKENWTRQSAFGRADLGIWESPVLFSLPLPGNPEAVRWCLLVNVQSGAPNGGSGTRYFLGDFDGATFRSDFPEERALWLDYGKDHRDTRILSRALPRPSYQATMLNTEYSQSVQAVSAGTMLSLGRGLQLQNTEEGLRVFCNPVKEVEAFRRKHYKFALGSFNGKYELTNDLGFDPAVAEYFIAVEASEGVSAKQVGFIWTNDAGDELHVGYERETKRFFIDRRHSGRTDFDRSFAPAIDYAPRTAPNRTIVLRIFIDHNSIELFADGGRTVMTDLIFPNSPYNHFYIFSEGGNAMIRMGEAWELSGK